MSAHVCWVDSFYAVALPSVRKLEMCALPSWAVLSHILEAEHAISLDVGSSLPLCAMVTECRGLAKT